MIPQDLHYDFAKASYLNFALPIIFILFWALYLYRRKKLKIYSSDENLLKLSTPRSNPLYFLKAFLFSLAWILAIFALMQPKGDGYYPNPEESSLEKDSLKIKPHEFIFLIDASASMAIDDAVNGKTRLDLAKEIADEIASRLKGESASLYAFTTNAIKMSPSTLDLFFVRMMLREISINEGNTYGTDFLKTLQTIREKHFKQKDMLRTLIILSDGGDTELETLKNQQNLRTEQILKTIVDPKNLNLRIFSIGIGSKTGREVPNVKYQGAAVFSTLDDTLLKLLSQKGRGMYYEASDKSALIIADNIFEKLQEDELFEKTSQNSKMLIFHHYFQIPLLIAILLLIFYEVFPNTSIFIILIMLGPLSLKASDENLRLAEKYFEAEDFKKSSTLFEEMLKLKYQGFEKAVLMYNLGTSYLFENNLNKAIETLESIHPKGFPPPFLIRNIKTNLAIAKFRLANQLIKDNDENSPKILYLLKSANENIKSAFKADCEVEALKGRDNCKISKNLQNLQLAIDEKLNGLKNFLNEDLIDVSLEKLSNESLNYFQKEIDDIYNSALTIKPVEIKDLQDLLNHAINLQHETQIMTANIAETPNAPQRAIDAVESGQKKTLEIANLYIKSALNLQSRLYELYGCQKKPWDEILPLFFSGYEKATNALRLIHEPSNAILEQELAIKYWKQIKTAENEPQKEKEDQKLPQNKSEQALQLLQQMQKGDHKKKAYPREQSLIERPW